MNRAADKPASRNAAHRPSSYATGVTLLLLAGVVLSSGGYLIRSVEHADGWQILFYRGIGFTLISLLFTLVRFKGRTARAYLDIGWPGLVAALALGAGFCAYLFAVLLTSVANVVFILSIGPIAAAVMGRVFLGERVAPFTWFAMTIAMAGIGLMMFEGIESGGWLGNLIALLAPLSFSVMVVAVRKRADRDMTPSLPAAGLIAMLVALPMIADFGLSAHDLAISLALGIFQVGLGFIFITLGARWVPAAQVPLFALTETALAPLWVWIAFGELPAGLALIGGLIVLIGVSTEAVAGLRRDRRKQQVS